MFKNRYSIHFTILIFFLLFPLSSFNNAILETISLRMEKRSLHKGRATVTIADIHFNAEKGKLVKDFIKPEGKIAINNREGDLIIYNKDHNQGFYEIHPEYNTEDNILFFILSRNISVEGLNEMGFQLINNETEDNKLTTRWLPPKFMKHLFSMVEISYNDHLPYLATYYDKNENIIVKTYFTDYESYPEITFPHTLTEFIYINENDSIINRVKFDEVQINENQKNDFFDLELP